MTKTTTRFVLWVGLTVTFGGFIGSGCELIASVDRGKIGGSGGFIGNGGAGGAVCDPVECNAMDTDCTDFECNADNTACDGTHQAFGTDCFTMGSGGGAPDGICDGEGVCIDSSCANGIQDPDETGVDCGGPCNSSSVGKCHNTIGCMVNADCKSNVCNNNVCEPCTVAADCEAGSYCNLENMTGQGGGGGGDATRGAICEPTKPSGMGETCGASGGDVECTDGFCRDGYCCDTTCGDACAACDIAASLGTCAAHAAGTDPDDDCPDGLPAGNCQQDNCNGTTGVTACNAPDTQICAQQSCTGNTLSAETTCSSGMCPTPVTSTCPMGLNCNGGGTACLGQCGSSADCSSNTDYCNPVDNQCDTQIATGVACVTGGPSDQCSSGNCADEFCCDIACTETCQSCRNVDTGAANGTCANVQSGGNPTDPDTNMTECASPEVCNGSNGMSACRLPNGATCSVGSDCLSNICNDEDICCDAACNGDCQTCTGGSCTPHAGGTDPEGMGGCPGSQACNGLGDCADDVGQACAMDSDCFTLYCDSQGTGNCELCTFNADCASNMCNTTTGICAP